MEILFLIFLSMAATQSVQSDDIPTLLEETMRMIENSQYEEALIYFDKILSIDENNFNALSNKGGVLIKLKKFDEAIESLDKALVLKPNSIEVLNNKAIALYEKKNYVGASNILIEAWNLDPDNSLTTKNVGTVINEIPYIREVGYVKIEVRDENNYLVAYTEAYDYLIKYPFGQSILSQQEWIDVEIDDQKLQKLVNQWEFDLDTTGLYSRTDISNSQKDTGFGVIQILHDGILVTKGDHVKVTLELLRSQ